MGRNDGNDESRMNKGREWKVGERKGRKEGYAR